MILYPVALFQQKIVITNKILHLSPKLVFFLHLVYTFLITLSSVRNSFSLLLCNIQLFAQSIQFNTVSYKVSGLRRIKQQDPPNDRSDKWNTDNRLYRDGTLPPLIQWQLSLKTLRKKIINHSRLLNLVTCAISATNQVESDQS